MNIFQELLSENLKYFRKSKNLTQFDLAELCDTSTNYIALIETCKKFPSSNMLEKIVNSLHIKPFELFVSRQKTKNNKINNKTEIINEITNLINKLHY